MLFMYITCPAPMCLRPQIPYTRAGEPLAHGLCKALEIVGPGPAKALGTVTSLKV